MAGYRIESVLGRGGMGVVYEATQLSLNRTVALKVLYPHLSQDPVFRARFRREGELQAAIDHPHIVTVYEAGEAEEGLFLAMRLIRGSTLKDIIAEEDFGGEDAVRLLKPIAEALDTAHAAGMTHRDIKPQNILVGAARPRLPRGLRPDAQRGGPFAHEDRPVRRHDRLRLARADPRRARRHRRATSTR